MDEAAHLAALRELVRVSRRQVRVFPLVDTTVMPSPYLDRLRRVLESEGASTALRRVPYHFQRGADTMLTIDVPDRHGELADPARRPRRHNTDLSKASARTWILGPTSGLHRLVQRSKETTTMRRPSMRRKYAIGAAATAIAAGAIAAPVFAASTGSSGGTTTQAHPPFGHGPWRAGGFIGDPSQYDATVAAKLGVTTAKLEAAEQAVRASLMPPTPGATGAAGPTGMPRAAERAAERAAFETALAVKLGVSTGQLTAAEAAAEQALILKRLPTLVAHNVLTQAQADQLTTAAGNGTFDSVLRTIEIANLARRLEAWVKANQLTQAQADQILNRAKSRTGAGGPGLGLGLGLGFGFRGPGGPAGPGGPGGRGPWGGAGPGGAAPSSSSFGTSTSTTTTAA